MKNNQLEQTILKTLRAGIESVEELTQKLENQEVEKKYDFQKNPIIKGGEKIENKTN